MRVPLILVRHICLVSLLTLAGVAVYLPGASGPFLFDDLINILEDPSIRIPNLEIESLASVVVREQGRFPVVRRPLPRLTFALDYYRSGFGFDPLVFKTTNILIHVLNGILVYLLCILLCRRIPRVREAGPRCVCYVAFFTAALWVFHPIQLTSVLYTVQRMTSLSGLFVVVGLLLYVIGRQRLADGRPRAFTWMAVGVAGGLILASACKETGVLLPVFALLIEWFFFSQNDHRTPRHTLVLFHGVALAVPVVVLAAMLFVPDLILHVYSIRSFNMLERLLTEGRVLFFYVSLLALPNIRRFGLFHDDFEVSHGLFDPVTTVISLAGWMVVLVALGWGLKRRALWSFAGLWFLAGHGMESTFLPLELVHEHRNYLPILGFFFVAIVYLAVASPARPAMARSVTHLPVLLLLIIVFSTWTRVNIWQDRLTLTTFMVRNHPDSYATQMAHAVAQSEAGYDLATIYRALRKAAVIDGDEVLPLLEMIKILRSLGFVEQSTPLPEDPSAPDLWKDELSTDPAWLHHAQEIARRQVDNRLRRARISSSTVVALINLSNCAVQGVPVCSALAEVNLSWHCLALDSPRIRDDERQMLAASADQLGRWITGLRSNVLPAEGKEVWRGLSDQLSCQPPLVGS